MLQGLANVLGQYLAIFQCSEQTDATCMPKIIQGSAMVSNSLGMSSIEKQECFEVLKIHWIKTHDSCNKKKSQNNALTFCTIEDTGSHFSMKDLVLGLNKDNDFNE